MAAARKSTVTEVPYDHAGNLCHHDSDGYRWHEGERAGPQWRPNTPFEATLVIDSMRSGRSAKYVILVDKDNHRYPMFITDLLDVLNSGDGITSGATGHKVWIVRKRGQNYGIALAPEGTTVP